MPPNSTDGPGIDLNALQEMLSKSKIELDRNNNVSEVSVEYGSVKIRGTPGSEGLRMQLEVPNPVKPQNSDQLLPITNKPPQSKAAFKHPMSKSRKRLERITHFLQDNYYLKVVIKISFLYFYMNCFLIQPWVNSWNPRIHTWKQGLSRFLYTTSTTKKNAGHPQSSRQSETLQTFDAPPKSQHTDASKDPKSVLPPELLEFLKEKGMKVATDQYGSLTTEAMGGEKSKHPDAHFDQKSVIPPGLLEHLKTQGMKINADQDGNLIPVHIGGAGGWPLKHGDPMTFRLQKEPTQDGGTIVPGVTFEDLKNQTPPEGPDVLPSQGWSGGNSPIFYQKFYFHGKSGFHGPLCFTENLDSTENLGSMENFDSKPTRFGN